MPLLLRNLCTVFTSHFLDYLSHANSQYGTWGNGLPPPLCNHLKNSQEGFFSTPTAFPLCSAVCQACQNSAGSPHGMRVCVRKLPWCGQGVGCKMKSTSWQQVCKNTVYPQAPCHKGSVVNCGSIVRNVAQRSKLLHLGKKIYSQTTSFSLYFSLNIQHHDIHVLFLVSWRVPKESWGEILLSIFFQNLEAVLLVFWSLDVSQVFSAPRGLFWENIVRSYQSAKDYFLSLPSLSEFKVRLHCMPLWQWIGWHHWLESIPTSICSSLADFDQEHLGPRVKTNHRSENVPVFTERKRWNFKFWRVRREHLIALLYLHLPQIRFSFVCISLPHWTVNSLRWETQVVLIPNLWLPPVPAQVELRRCAHSSWSRSYSQGQTDKRMVTTLLSFSMLRGALRWSFPL